MKTKVLKYNLAGRSQVFVVSLLALLRKTGLAGEETSGAIPAEVLDTLKIQLVSPNVTGAQILTTKLTRPCHYSVEGNELTIALGELNPGQHRLTVKSVYGTNTRSLLIIDATVPVGDGETSEAINIDVAAVSSITPNDSEIVEDVETLKGEMQEAQGAIGALQDDMTSKASKEELQEAIDESLGEIQEAMENLPDGQAVSAQVALNTAAIENLQADEEKQESVIEIEDKSIVPEEIVITDNEDNEVLKINKDGLEIKEPKGYGKVFPEGAVGARIITASQIEFYDANGAKMLSIGDNGIVDVKTLYVNGTPLSDILTGMTGVEVNLPSQIYAVVGDTLQLFFRGIVKASNPYAHNIKVTCDIGAQTPRYFEVTPASAHVGSHSLKIDIRDDAGNILKTKTTALVVKNTTSLAQSNKNVLCFGDSLTSGGVWCKEASRRLAGQGGTPAGLELSNVHFVGKLSNDGVGYFGAGGWSWRDFVTSGRPAFRVQVSGVTTVTYGATYTNNGHTYTILENNTTGGVGSLLLGVGSALDTPTDGGVLTKASGTGDETITFSSYSADSQNPLWDYENDKMTFVPYANAYCDGSIDVVYTLLSWNEQTRFRTDFSQILQDIKTFADTLHAEFPNAKLKIMGLQVPSVNGGLGANYGAGGSSYSDKLGLVVTVLNQNDAFAAFAADEDYSSFVEFVNVSSQFDSEYNMPFAEKNVNTRNGESKENIGTNGVHPSDAGQMQIADVVFRNIINYLNV